MAVLFGGMEKASWILSWDLRVGWEFARGQAQGCRQPVQSWDHQTARGGGSVTAATLTPLLSWTPEAVSLSQSSVCGTHVNCRLPCFPLSSFCPERG